MGFRPELARCALVERIECSRDVFGVLQVPFPRGLDEPLGQSVQRLAPAPAIAARVSASPPSETAFRTASSRLVDSSAQISAVGTVPWQVTSNRWDGRMSSTVRLRSYP